MQASRPPWILPSIVLAQLAGTSLWFAGNAVLPDLQAEFNLGQAGVATITSAVQVGFIAGTLAFASLNLADRFSPRKLFFVCSVMGALSNGAIALLPAQLGELAPLVGFRFLTGFFLAGIYPIGMRIAAGWYKEGLGRALGWLVGALVLGTALPHLLRGIGQSMPWTQVTLCLSGVALAGGFVMYQLVPDGPHLARASAFDPRALVTIFSSRELRASAFGYFGHMWELYTFWAMVPILIASHALSSKIDHANVGVLSFLVIGVGAIGCVAGGIISRLKGSAPVAASQLATSGVCCLLSPIAYLMPFYGFLAFLLVWGIAVAGDSPQFSALTAANAPREFVGSALTIVNCIGFSLTVLSIQLASATAEVLPIEWLFVPIAVGPALGLLAFRQLLWPSTRAGQA